MIQIYQQVGYVKPANYERVGGMPDKQLARIRGPGYSAERIDAVSIGTLHFSGAERLVSG